MSLSIRHTLVLFTALLASAGSALAQGPPSPVRVAPVVREDVAERRMVTGELRALRQAEVAGQEAGLVVEMLVEVGMVVEEGQVLARVDSRRLELAQLQLRAERSAAVSAVAEEEASRDRWQSEVDSLSAAAERGAGNSSERRDASTELRRAIARLERAGRDLEVYDAGLALLERRLTDLEITAPFSGTVTQKLTERGEWLSEGDSVCEIVETDILEVVLDVPQRYLAALAARPLDGQEFVVRLDTGEVQLSLEQVRIVPRVDDRSRSFQLVGRVRNTEGVLATGLSVVGWVPTGTSGEHLIVPTDAIMRNEMGVFVYVPRVMGEGPPSAVPSNVQILFELPGSVVVDAAGLSENDTVVIEGNERLFPMAPVMPMSGEPTRDAAAGAPPQGDG